MVGTVPGGTRGEAQWWPTAPGGTRGEAQWRATVPGERVEKLNGGPLRLGETRGKAQRWDTVPGEMNARLKCLGRCMERLNGGASVHGCDLTAWLSCNRQP